VGAFGSGQSDDSAARIIEAAMIPYRLVDGVPAFVAQEGADA
jgi:hypothetical protein